MSSQSRKLQADALRALAVLIESEPASTVAPTTTEAPFVDRCPPWLEVKVFKRAQRELAAEGKAFRPGGRRVLVRLADLISWVEQHPVKNEAPAESANETT